MQCQSHQEKEHILPPFLTSFLVLKLLYILDSHFHTLHMRFVFKHYQWVASHNIWVPSWLLSIQEHTLRRWDQPERVLFSLWIVEGSVDLWQFSCFQELIVTLFGRMLGVKFVEIDRFVKLFISCYSSTEFSAFWSQLLA